ncbi:MAG TPA: SDR family NAD(P)-dependent oxidoreductase [Thermomicrobiaceae bacterium]|nr:SDR family NAD(P)-dependent oxidoreductase [Thermomicrobiaceae bacterium]
MVDGQRPGGRLAGKVAIVTGAARGIGRATAVAMAHEGASVAGFDIAGPVSPISTVTPATREDLEHTGELVRSEGAAWMSSVVDQRAIQPLRQSVQAVVDRFGRIDILFANAGFQAFKPLAEMDDPDWYDQIDNNLNGTANMLRAVIPTMIDQQFGRIIITSSTQGRHGTKFGSSYSASKWGLIGLMKSAALELGEYGITVNALIPGLIDTALTRHEERYAQALEEAGKTPSGDRAKDEQSVEQQKSKQVPLEVAFIQPEDVAPVVVFLATDEARMVTGATYDVTAGDSAHYSA